MQSEIHSLTNSSATGYYTDAYTPSAAAPLEIKINVTDNKGLPSLLGMASSSKDAAFVGIKKLAAQIAFMSAYFLLGMLYYSHSDLRWGWGESLYFILVSITTIGYGDEVVTADHDKLFTIGASMPSRTCHYNGAESINTNAVLCPSPSSICLRGHSFCIWNDRRHAW